MITTIYVIYTTPVEEIRGLANKSRKCDEVDGTRRSLQMKELENKSENSTHLMVYADVWLMLRSWVLDPSVRPLARPPARPGVTVT